MADALYGGSFVVYQGSGRPVTFSLATPASIAGQTFEVRVIDPRGNVSTVTIPNGSLGITSGTGVITASLTTAITTALPFGTYRVELWRTDTGNVDKKAWITIEVQP